MSHSPLSAPAVEPWLRVRVGRKQLPKSIGGAMIHAANHTQRHTGQVVTTAKVLKAMRAQDL